VVICLPPQGVTADGVAPTAQRATGLVRLSSVRRREQAAKYIRSVACHDHAGKRQLTAKKRGGSGRGRRRLS
jgi:hypothetical protein